MKSPYSQLAIFTGVLNAYVLFEVNCLEAASLIMILNECFGALPLAIDCRQSHAQGYTLTE